MSEQASSSRSPDPIALTQFEGVRQLFHKEDYKAVSKLCWQGGAARGPPTPVGSGIATPAETPKPAQETMEVDTEGDQTGELLQPFSFQSDAAIEVAAGALGVDINDQNAIPGWLAQPVTNNRQVFDMVRSYHEKVIRPEYYSLVCQIEQGLKQVNEGCSM